MIPRVHPGKLTAPVLDETKMYPKAPPVLGDDPPEGSEMRPTRVHSVHLQEDGPCEEERDESMYFGRCLPKLLTDSDSVHL